MFFSKKSQKKFGNSIFLRNFAPAIKKTDCHGRLAQLVQSVCLTSRGSAVRIRQRPQCESIYFNFNLTIFKPYKKQRELN